MRSSRATAGNRRTHIHPNYHGHIFTIPHCGAYKAATAKEVARGIFDGWIALFGIMKVLLSDGSISRISFHKWGNK
jgi:hypothetical protein